ncbi:hypothetical protein Cgig2_023526 [Carnegiea gigantea]|uniref:RHOMBOID-like protein n=1 Tax=Carnegiea gigantea TaxID=171969 RepID=A0A9Q1JKJ8_9CARY|nr:hypothetical protein Cgig2_023526 [Carnegiea gigantea]
MEAHQLKEQTQIDIKTSLQELPVFSADNGVDEPGEEQRIPFFGSISTNRETTWVISLFVFVHLVAFFCTMIVNNCWTRSHGDCNLIFFQPLPENPLLGPSSSVMLYVVDGQKEMASPDESYGCRLDDMGALRRLYLTNNHAVWRIITSVLLHAGAFHLIINLSSVIFIGINLEQKFGPLRTGIIYILSAFGGGLMAALFVEDSPQVCSSAALFGLIGASFSGLIRDWKLYTKKFLAVAGLLLVLIINSVVGLLPYVNNFSNMGGFLLGFLLGFALFFSPHLRKPALHKGLFDYGGKRSVTIKEKLDRPALRIVCLILFSLMVGGLVVAIVHAINVNKYCSWCHYIDCVPSRKWICDTKPPSCKTTESGGQTALMCLESDNFRILPFTGISEDRLQELCSLMCSYH